MLSSHFGNQTCNAIVRVYARLRSMGRIIEEEISKDIRVGIIDEVTSKISCVRNRDIK